LTVGNSPGSLDPNGILRGRDAPFRGWGWLPDILRIGASVRLGGMRPAVEQFEKRIPDRIGRTQAPLRVPASAEDSSCCDPTKNGDKFSHFRRAPAAVFTGVTIPQNAGFRKRSRKSFCGLLRCGTCPLSGAVVIRFHETDAPASRGLCWLGDGAGFRGARRAAAHDRPGVGASQAHDRGDGEGDLHEEAVAGGEPARAKDLRHGREARLAGFRPRHPAPFGNTHRCRR